MFKTISHLLSLIRFSHTIFALPFALLAAMMAWRLKAEELSGWGMIEFADDGETIVGHGPTAYFVKLGPFQFNWLSEGEGSNFPFAMRWQELLGIFLCMITARSAAMAFNRLADRDIDAENPRTSKRHIPAGILSVNQVKLFAIGCSIAFVASTLLFLPNRLPLYLSVPVLAFLCGYSYTKRFTSLAHFLAGDGTGTLTGSGLDCDPR